jgi:SET domain-containing protein
MGVFAKFDLDGKICIGITHIAPIKKDLGRQRTPLGGFINHSENPNCFIVVETEFSRMYTVRPIMQGEELTVYYTGY